jgi:hypothetical protein
MQVLLKEYGWCPLVERKAAPYVRCILVRVEGGGTMRVESMLPTSSGGRVESMLPTSREV